MINGTTLLGNVDEITLRVDGHLATVNSRVRIIMNLLPTAKEVEGTERDEACNRHINSIAHFTQSPHLCNREKVLPEDIAHHLKDVDIGEVDMRTEAPHDDRESAVGVDAHDLWMGKS